MKAGLLFATALLALLASPVFAVGNVTITGIGMMPNANFTNSNTSAVFLNLSFAVTTETGSRIVNITRLNISLGNGSTTGNVSAVELYMSNDTTVIGSAVMNLNATAFNVSLTNTLVVNSSANTSVIVRFNITFNATTSQLISAILGSAADVLVNDASNVTVAAAILSNATQLQNIHANVTVEPKFVDTNVINQSIVFSITPTGKDGINRTVIWIPSGYNFTNISNVEYGGGNESFGGSVTATTAPNYINITMPATTGRVKVFFNVNTSTTRVNSQAFSVFIDGVNLSNISSDPIPAGSTNITTQQLINVSNVALAKGAAIVNGTDYWEFNFTISYTANVTGTIQFKMTNWTDASSNVRTINLNTTGGVYYASLRNNSGNFSDPNAKFNVTNVYGDIGINRTVTDGSSATFILRMIIPSDTPISSTWAATYNWLFRALY